ncbi:MAG: DNA repair protein RecN [Deltaproteobacteria bacterium]|nr:DNA repair protein RecN [Deltaproteobacteria bacterium]
MLSQLTISDFAIINYLEIDFQPGLNILSGETGAGKSIIMNAVNLILGGRASSDLIRTGAREARVEALFTLPETPFFKDLISEMGIPYHGDLLIKRSISREGRNKIMINDSIATIQMLSRLSVLMISISGQHEHQHLLKPDNHLYLLDDFGGLSDDRISLNELFKEYEAMMAQRQRLRNKIKEGRERQELTNFQINEINAAHITPGEDAELEAERKRLRYAEELKELVSESYQTIYEKEGSIISELSLCVRNVEKGVSMDQRLDAIRKALSSARAELEDAGLELRDLQETIMIDPARLDAVEERLQTLNKLKKKYGGSLEDVLILKKSLSGIMENLDNEEKELKEMDSRLERLRSKIISKAMTLSGQRKKIAGTLQTALERELGFLDMKGTRFEVRFDHNELKEGEPPDTLMKHVKADGYDRLEFMLSPNVGEDLKPLSRIASGGELSRIMLALKTILAGKTSVETLVFDEVDAGIGGATAEVVGDKLRALAKFHQILCITHLPQIASKGEAHFLVQKRVEGNRTQTFIRALETGERVQEIARLLGGKVISNQALAHAKEMLGQREEMNS